MLRRSWQEIVAQIAAVLYLRAEAYPEYNEFQALSDHQSIVEAYSVGDLDKVQQENRRINIRVATECVIAVQRLNQQETIK